MSRKIRIAAAQMGPVHLRDSREHCVTRMIEMMREAHATGCKVIVFPELALSSFFARHWMETQTEIDAFFEIFRAICTDLYSIDCDDVFTFA